MNAIYECTVMHKRFKPNRRAFVYRVFMLSVDVDELPAICRRTPLLSHNRFNLFSIDDRDHVGGSGIRRGLEEWLQERGSPLETGCRIRMITFPGVLGYGFNPVTFYYLLDAGGTPVAAVAEVVNTFREMKLYLIDGRDGPERLHSLVPKDFYVSPFSDPGAEFDFTLEVPQDEWRVAIDTHEKGARVLASGIHGRACEIQTSTLLWFAIKYPFLSLKIIGLIHWRAFLLWAAKVPYFRKSDRREAQRDVLRPHSSLTEHQP